MTFFVDPPMKKRGRPLHKVCPYCGAERQVKTDGGLFDELRTTRTMNQRTIKFRAWDGKKMYDGNSIVAVRQSIEVAPTSVSVFKLDGFFLELNRAGYTFMQWTGLKDMHGKEIYEGDVLSYDGVHGEVMFHEGAFVLNWDHIHWPLFARLGEWQVVGNIYEQPELMKLDL